MIATLTGSNSFRLDQALQQLVGDFVAQHGDLALERLDGETAEFVKLQEALQSLPFLSSKKMVLVRSAGGNKQFLDHAEALFADIPETTELVLVEPKLDKRTAFYKLLKKATTFQEFTELDESGLSNWLSSVVREAGSSISSSDARYVVERVGPLQQKLGSEIEKLVLASFGNPQRQVTRQMIDDLIERTPQSSIFQLLEAAFAGNYRLAQRLYAEQRALKVETPQIIAMLSWQLHILLLIKTAGERSMDQVAVEAKLNPYVVRKSQSVARVITLARLKELVSRLLSIDSRSKRQPIDVDEALQHFLLTLVE